MDTKSFLQSKTIHGVLITLLAIALKFANSKGWLTSLTPENAGVYVDNILQVLELLGLGYTAWGRFAVTKQISLVPGGKDDDDSDGGGNMRIPAFLVGAMLAIALLSSTAGCAQNETNRAAQGIVLVTAHAEAALAMREAHVLTREQELQLLALIQAEQAAAKAYYASIAAGDPAGLASAKAALAAATAAAAAELAKYKGPPPATRPAGIQFDR